MSDYKGDFAEDATVTMTFNTFDSDGKSVTVTDLATTDVFIYKDGVVLADPDAGVTLTLNAGTGDGAHIVKVDMSSDAQYVTGADYEAKFEGITIDTQTPINIFVGEWSCQNRFMRGTDSAATSAKQDTMETTLNDVPTTAEFNARTIPSADYVIVSDTLARVTLVDTVTTNTDKNTLAAADIVTGGAITTSSGAVSEVGTILINGITTSSIATDAINAASVKADAVTKIQNGLATEAKQDAGDVVTTRISAIQEADRIIDFPNGTLTYNTKGTSNALLTKDLKDPDDVAVNSTEDVIAAEENV